MQWKEAGAEHLAENSTAILLYISTEIHSFKTKLMWLFQRVSP